MRGREEGEEGKGERGETGEGFNPKERARAEAPGAAGGFRVLEGSGGRKRRGEWGEGKKGSVGRGRRGNGVWGINRDCCKKGA